MLDVLQPTTICTSIMSDTKASKRLPSCESAPPFDVVSASKLELNTVEGTAPLEKVVSFNAIIEPQLYEQHRSLVTYAKCLLVEGALQNVDGVIHIRAKHVEELNVTAAPIQSHDFH